MGLAYGDLSKSGIGGGSGAGDFGGGVIGPKSWGYRTIGVPGADDSTDPGILGRRLEVPESRYGWKAGMLILGRRDEAAELVPVGLMPCF